MSFVRLLFTLPGLAFLAALAGFIAFAAYFQPAWLIDPLRTGAGNVLSAVGGGLALLALWALAALALFKFGFLAALRKWRYIAGAALLTAGAFAVLSYFTVEFPLIGDAPIGGDAGMGLRGAEGTVGVLRTSVLVIAGAWFVAPRALNAVARGAGTVAAAVGVALGHAAAAAGRGVAEWRRTRAESRAAAKLAQEENLRSTASADPHFRLGLDSLDAEPPDFLKDTGRPQRRSRYSEAQAFPDPPPSYKRSEAAAAPSPEKPPARSTAAAWGLLDDPPARPAPAAVREAPPAAPPVNIPERAVATAQAANAPPAPQEAAYAAAPAESGAAIATPEESPADAVPDDSGADDAAYPEPAAAGEAVYAADLGDSGMDDAVYAAPVERAYSVEAEEEKEGEEESEAPAEPDGPPPEPVVMPSLSLLAPPVPAIAVSEEHEETGRKIEQALAEYGVDVQVNEIRPGPSVTMFGLVPGWKRERPAAEEQPDRGSRVKVNSILARKNDLKLALSSPNMGIEAVPHESLVVVHVPEAQDTAETAELIVSTLADHGIEVAVREVRAHHEEGWLFGLEPGWTRRASRPQAQQPTGNRVRVQSILAREHDLALALAAPSLRIQAPVPGESIVGIEVPNRSSSPVTVRTVMESEEYQRMAEAGGLPVALGQAPAGEPVAVDLTKMPHLLIAGATGSGKSVCMNTIICSLIKDQPPSRVRMLLIDPKRVELTPYNGIPHLVTPVVVEPDEVVRLLRGAVQEMQRRYKLLEEAGTRTLQSYNRNRAPSEQLPFFVICIDELADLMMTASADVETCLVRLAQLARAVGIHLVVATQRPTVNVITGLIKANFPSRIAFSVASQMDSRTILDSNGAESLLGRGDMLFLSSDSPKARRVQGVFISEEETAALSDHWRVQPPDPDLHEIPLEEMAREAEIAAAESEAAVELDENDSLYDQALQVAAATRQLSTSLLQRRLRIGYPRAARLMDQLEDEGIVASTGDPGKPREVLYIPDA